MGKIIAWALVHKDLLEQNRGPVGKLMPRDASATYANAPVSAINPAHYRQGSGVECIDVVRHLPFAQGNAMKYVWRAGHKDDIKEDLQKALWYINDCIAQNAGVAIMEGSIEADLLTNHRGYLSEQGDNIRMNTLLILGLGDMKMAAVCIEKWLNSL